MITQFNIREVKLFVPMDSQKEAKDVKTTLGKIDTVLKVECDRANKMVTVTRNSSENMQTFKELLVDTLERKGFRGSEIRDNEVEIEVDADADVSVSAGARPGRKRY